MTFNMETITQDQLIAVLSRINIPMPIGFSHLTKVKLNKTAIVRKDNPTVVIGAGEDFYNSLSEEARNNTELLQNEFVEVRKLSKISGFIHDYENSVNLQRIREGLAPDFKAETRAWGVAKSLALIEHKGKYSLSVKVQKTKLVSFFNRTDQDILKVIAKTKLEVFIPAYRPSHNQGTAKEISYRTYGLDDITRLSIAGHEFKIKR